MKIKKNYIQPCTEVVFLKMGQNLLSLSEVMVYQDIETNGDDEQYSRRRMTLWDEEW